MAALSKAEAAVYDRQIRVWGVDTQQRCIPDPLTPHNPCCGNCNARAVVRMLLCCTRFVVLP